MEAMAHTRKVAADKFIHLYSNPLWKRISKPSTMSRPAFLPSDAEGLIQMASPKQPQFTLLPAVIHNQMRYMLKIATNRNAHFSTHLRRPKKCRKMSAPRPDSRPTKNLAAIDAIRCDRCAWSARVYSNDCTGTNMV